MLSGLDVIEILSEHESPVWPMAMEEEVMSMPVGSSSIPKQKRQAQRPSPTPPEKQQTRTSMRMQGEGTAHTGSLSLGVVEFVALQGVSVNDILEYIAPTCPGANPRQLSKN